MNKEQIHAYRVWCEQHSLSPTSHHNLKLFLMAYGEK